MIRKLALRNFMSYDNITFLFTKGVTVISAGNWCGKTTIVNAIRVALGRRDRERYKNLDEFIRHGENTAVVDVVVEREGETHTITKILRRGMAPRTKIDGHTASVEEARRVAFLCGIDVNNPIFVVNRDRMEVLVKDAILRSKFLIDALGYGDALKELEKLEDEIKNKRNRLNELEKELNEKLSNMATLEIRAEGYRKKMKLKAQIDSLRSLMELSRKKSTLMDYQRLRNKVARMKKDLESKKKRLEELKIKLEKLNEAYMEWEKKLDPEVIRTLQERYEVLRKQLRDRETLSREDREFLRKLSKARKFVEKTGFIGPLIEIITVDDEFSTAAEAALYDLLTAVIAPSKGALMMYLSKHKLTGMDGITVLVPPSEEIGVNESAMAILERHRALIMGFLVNHVRVNPAGLRPGQSIEEMERVIRRVLSPYNAVVTNTEHGASYLSEKCHIKCVSVNGFVFTPHEKNGIEIKRPVLTGLLQMGSFKYADLQQRMEEIERMKKEAEMIKEELERIKKGEAEKAITNIERERKSVIREIRSLESDIETLSDEITSKESYLGSLKAEIKGIKIPPDVPPVDKLIVKISAIEKELSRYEMYSIRDLKEYELLQKNADTCQKEIEKIKKDLEILERNMQREREKLGEIILDKINTINKKLEDVLSSVGAKGELSFDRENFSLEILGAFGAKELAPLSSGQHSSGAKTVLLVAFILAVQRYAYERTGASTFFFDEFDVHLDPKNTRLLMRLIRSNAVKAQYIILTPENVVIKEYADVLIQLEKEGDEPTRIALVLTRNENVARALVGELEVVE